MPEFRIPLKCNNCNKLGWDYQVWNGQQFITDYITPCCDKRAYEIQGKPQQYVELKYTNDKKIYQGDFVERYEITQCCQKKRWLGIFRVIWHDTGFYCSNENYGLLGMAGDDEREVIGNITENPELIKQ